MPRINDFPWKEEQIVELARRFPTPFHLYDERSIRRQCQNMREAFSWCPDYRNYFALKATPNPHIMRILHEEGCGADCSSMAELILSERVGLHQDEIMFTSNNTPLKEYAVAKRLGAIVNFDDVSHIDFLHKNGGLPDLISFRYNPGPTRAGNAIIGDPKEAKFGTTMQQLLEGYQKCKSLGVKRFGLHAMVVSNCTKESELIETARMLFTIVAELRDKLGIRVEMVNLGGGWGIPYKPEVNTLNPSVVGTGIQKVYAELIEAKGLAPLRVVTECGRYITGPGGFLISRVVHLKRTYKNYVGIDACMANLMRPGMYGAYHHISIIRDDKSIPGTQFRDAEFPDNAKDLITKGGVFDVVGGLCENNDKFAIDRALDVEPKPGDVAVIHDTGAHGHSMGFNYNGKPRSAEYLYHLDGTATEIRRAETLEDVFATLTFKDANGKIEQSGSTCSLLQRLKTVGRVVARACTW